MTAQRDFRLGNSLLMGDSLFFKVQRSLGPLLIRGNECLELVARFTERTTKNSRACHGIDSVDQLLWLKILDIIIIINVSVKIIHPKKGAKICIHLAGYWFIRLKRTFRLEM